MAQPQKLTKTLIDGLEPHSKDAIYWDAELKGFGVKVTPRGRKVFIVMHRPKGHVGAAKKYTVGTYGELTAQQARDRAREILAESSKGIDAHAKEQAEKRRMQSDKIGDLIDQFIEKHASQNRTGNETKRIFERDIRPKVGKLSVHEIDKHKIISIIEGIHARGAPLMANRSLAAIRKFFNWCVSRGIIDRSPAQGITAIAKERSRERTLTPNETRAAISAARQTSYPFGPIVELLFMTAQRRDEVAAMRWSELDIDNAVWTIPGERAKNGKSHDVHLSKCSVALLRSLPRFLLPDTTESDLVFTTIGTTPFSGFSKSKNALDEKMLAILRKQAADNGSDPKAVRLSDWRLHDIRRTVTTELVNLGVSPYVADAILNHRSGAISGVMAVYQRAKFVEERREALDRWCDRIDELLSQDA